MWYKYRLVKVFAPAVKKEVWKVGKTIFFCGHDESIVGGININW
jgi:hypothetical protein